MSVILFSSTTGDISLTPSWPNAGAPTSGTSGTLAGLAQKGDLLVDTTNGNLYQNTNTQASPTWSQFLNSGELASPPPIGATTPNAANFTFARESYAGGLVAVGTSRTNALALTAATNRIVTAASSAVGVTLPPSATVGIGGIVRVINDGPANAFNVYGAGSDTIDTIAGSTGVVLTNAFQCDYQVDAAGAFVSYRLAVTRSA